jgi:glycosyltransferase involved in cell wall biosynthesis
VLTAMPNYPAGRVFDGYRRKLRARDEIDGVRVVRTCIWPSNSSRALPRLLSYLSFVVSSVLLGAWGLGKQDLLLFESPPLFLVPSGWLLGKLKRCPVIMNVSDIWPDIIVRMGYGEGGASIKAMEALERFGYRHSDVVALTNPGAMRQIAERFPDVTTTVISNGADIERFRPELANAEARASLGAAEGDLLVGYFGLHGLAQGLEAVVDAADKLRSDPRVKVVLVGDGPTKADLVARAENLGLDNLRFFDPVPKPEVPPLLASCDVALVPLGVRLPGTMPSKIYETLAAGVPVVAAKGCEAESLVGEFDVGRVFEPLDAEELAAAVAELLSGEVDRGAMSERCVALAARFSRDLIAARTDRILQAVANGAELPDVSW